MQPVPPSVRAPALPPLLQEAWELVLARAEADLSLQPRPLAQVVASLQDRMRHPADPPETTVTVLARLLAAPLEEIIADPNQRLYRTRRLLPLHKVRQQDTRCLQWLARQPGRSIPEKVSTKNRLLAVSRNVGPTRLEHSFALTLCARLEPKVSRYLQEVGSSTRIGDSGHRRLKAAQRLASALSDYRAFAARHGITELRTQARPNNALLHDRRYRRLWLAARWLAEELARQEALASHLAPIWQELVAFTAAGALLNLDLCFVDPGIAPCELDAAPRLLSNTWPGLWFRASNEHLQKIRLELAQGGAVVVWLLQTDGVALQRKRFLIATAPGPATDWSLLQDPSLQNGWAGFLDERDLLAQALAEWSGISLATPPAAPSPDGIRPAGFLRVGATELRFQRNGSVSKVPACAVGVHPDKPQRSESVPLFLAGHTASRLRLFRLPAPPDFPQEPNLPRGVPGSWIVPGWFFRSCHASRPALIEARRSLLRTVTGPAPIRTLVAARPHRLSFSSQTRFHDALPAPMERKLIIPQPVAVALAWMEKAPGRLAEHDWLAFMDLDGELPDLALLQCKRFNPPAPDLGWLRYPPLARNPTPPVRWTHQLAAHLLARNGLPVTGAAVGALLAQLPESLLLRTALAQQPEATAWLRSSAGWRRLSIHKEDVLNALHNWAANLKQHVEKELRGRSSFAVTALVVSGEVSAAPNLQEVLRSLPIPVQFTSHDTVPAGLAIFERRVRQGLPTYRDFIPDLKIMVCGGTGQSFWHSLFPGGTSGLEASVDQPLVGQEFEFALAARRTTFPLPMQSGEDRAEENPLIRLPSMQPADCPVLVHARYEAAGRGLVLSLRSKEPGLLPIIELEWDNLAADIVSDEPPALPHFPHLSLPADELASHAADLASIFSGLGAAHQAETRAQLKQALRRLSRFLQQHVVSSSPQEWELLQDHESREAVTEILARLGFLHSARGADLASPAFPDGFPAFKRPAGKVDLSYIELDQDLQFQLNICLRRFAAASPDAFLKHCLAYLQKPKPQKKLLHACIHSLGRCASTWMPRGPRRTAADTIIQHVTDLTAGPLAAASDWEEFGWWARALVLYLAGNPWQIPLLPPELLQRLLGAMHDAVRKLASSACDTENAWRPVLASLLYLRYGMRIPDLGPKLFGPRSSLARDLVHELHQASQSPAAREVAKVGLKSFLENPEILQGDTAFDKVASIWEGKAAGVLLRAAPDDE